MENNKTKEVVALTGVAKDEDPYSFDIYDRDPSVANNRVKLAKLLLFVFALGILAMGFVLRFVNLPVSLLSGLSPTTWYMIGAAAAVCLQSLFFLAANKKLEDDFDKPYLYGAISLVVLAALMGVIVAGPFIPAFSHALTDSVVKMSIEYGLIAIGALTMIGIALAEKCKPQAARVTDDKFGNGEAIPSITRLPAAYEYSPSYSKFRSESKSPTPAVSNSTSVVTGRLTRSSAYQYSSTKVHQAESKETEPRSPSVTTGRFGSGQRPFKG